MKNSVIMAFTRAEKPHLFIVEFPALLHPCVKRNFFFHSNVPFTYPKGGSESSPASAFFFLSIWQKRTIHGYSCQWTDFVWQVSLLSLHSHQRTLKIERMEIYYIEADVLEMMRACSENLSAHVADCMRETAVRNSENDWTIRMSAYSLTSHRILLSFDR